MTDYEEEDEKRAEKRAKSEAMRLEGIRQKAELERQRQETLRLALENVDQKKQKIVFVDSDDDEGEGYEDDHEPTIMATSSSKKPRLFDESDEEEIDEIHIENRHSGKKGEKLMQMEAHFASDDRFKMDDKFVSSDEEEEEVNELTEEKRKQREMLSKVLGKTVKVQQKTVKSGKSESKNIPPRPFTRFDPDNEEHVAWMNKYGKKKAPEPEKEEGDEKEEGEKTTGTDIRKTEGTFFEMDSSFANELKAKLAQKESHEELEKPEEFSFLNLVRGKRPAPQHKEEEEDRYVPAKKINLPSTSSKQSFVLEENAVLPDGPASSIFFVTGEESHIRSVVANFKRTQSIEKTVGGWSTYRDAIMKIYKHKKKEALQKQKTVKNLLAKKPQQKNLRIKMAEE